MAERSNSGCWTCRARRKKCDESQPECSTCAALHLPCHGYGPKPTWMDRGVKEREVAASLRKIVRQTLTLQRLRLSQQVDSSPKTPLDKSRTSSHRDEVHATALNPPEDALDTDLNIMGMENLDLANPGMEVISFNAASDLENLVSSDSLASQRSPTAAAAAITTNPRNERVDRLLTYESWSSPPDQFEEDQASLLMHFFDHVLPLQFSFYNPSILEGGRGWLLSILIRTKPLYHVVLSLAAYHQQSVLVRGSGIPCKASLAKLQERHIDCIKVLRFHLQKFSSGAQVNSSEEQVDIMACITFLIALELYRGDTNDWQMHLRGASALWPTFGRDQSITQSATHTQKLAIEFFSGVITWYEIFSCASTGRRPFPNSKIDDVDIFRRIHFDKLMGCESWMMHLIMEIAALDEWKRNLESKGDLSTWDLSRRAAELQMRLERNLTLGSGNSNRTPPVDEHAPQTSYPGISESTVKTVTQIFGGAALVYLQVLVVGPYPSAPEIEQGVSRTMAALNALTNKSLVRNMLWPVCIAGSMANVDHQPYWRDLVANVSRPRWSFGYPSKVLEIMEECWQLRAKNSDDIVVANWRTAMKNLDMTVLLV